MKSALPKQDFGVTQTVLSKNALQDQRYQEGRKGGRKPNFCGLHRRRRSQRCNALVFWLEDEGKNSLSPSFESRRSSVTCVNAPKFEAHRDFSLARATLRSGLPASGNSIKAKRYGIH